MRPKRRSAGSSSHERWVVSYADFITLMFAFFVVLFSSAQIDKQRTVQLASAIESAFQQMGANPANMNRSALPAGARARKTPESAETASKRD